VADENKSDSARSTCVGPFTTTFKAQTKKAAHAELRRLLGTLDDGTHVDPHRKTVTDWLREWITTIKGGGRADHLGALSPS
jgi:hypothetical protein